MTTIWESQFEFYKIEVPLINEHLSTTPKNTSLTISFRLVLYNILSNFKICLSYFWQIYLVNLHITWPFLMIFFFYELLEVFSGLLLIWTWQPCGKTISTVKIPSKQIIVFRIFFRFVPKNLRFVDTQMPISQSI